MHEQDLAIVKALVPVAWADGRYADREKQAMEALLDAYQATDDEKKAVLEYAAKPRTLDDIHLQDLSAEDRRTLLQHAVLLCWSDGDYSASERAFVQSLAKKLRLPEDETSTIVEQASERARKHLNDLT